MFCISLTSTLAAFSSLLKNSIQSMFGREKKNDVGWPLLCHLWLGNMCDRLFDMRYILIMRLCILAAKQQHVQIYSWEPCQNAIINVGLGN